MAKQTQRWMLTVRPSPLAQTHFQVRFAGSPVGQDYALLFFRLDGPEPAGRPDSRRPYLARFDGNVSEDTPMPAADKAMPGGASRKQGMKLLEEQLQILRGRKPCPPREGH